MLRAWTDSIGMNLRWFRSDLLDTHIGSSTGCRAYRGQIAGGQLRGLTRYLRLRSRLLPTFRMRLGLGGRRTMRRTWLRCPNTTANAYGGYHYQYNGETWIFHGSFSSPTLMAQSESVSLVLAVDCARTEGLAAVIFGALTGAVGAIAGGVNFIAGIITGLGAARIKLPAAPA